MKIARQLGVVMTATFVGHEQYFPDDKEARDIYSITLRRGKKGFSFRFGQSISESTGDGGNPPTFYNVMSGLQKYDPGDFENFCSEFGYDTDSRQAEKTWRAVRREYQHMAALFSPEELELLGTIQ